jgi:hypothetical protein
MFFELASDQGLVESIAFAVRRKVYMQMRDAAAEYVNINTLSVCRMLEHLRAAGDDGTERLRFFPVEVLDVLDVSLWFEIREPRSYLARSGARRKSPQVVGPDFGASKLLIDLGNSAERADEGSHYPRLAKMSMPDEQCGMNTPGAHWVAEFEG